MDSRALGIVWPVKPDTLVDVTWAIGSEGLSKPLGFHDAAAISRASCGSHIPTKRTTMALLAFT